MYVIRYHAMSCDETFELAKDSTVDLFTGMSVIPQLFSSYFDASVEI